MFLFLFAADHLKGFDLFLDYQLMTIEFWSYIMHIWSNNVFIVEHWLCDCPGVLTVLCFVLFDTFFLDLSILILVYHAHRHWCWMPVSTITLTISYIVSDESPRLKHDGPGLLSMPLADRDSLGSHFSITLAANHSLDRFVCLICVSLLVLFLFF